MRHFLAAIVRRLTLVAALLAGLTAGVLHGRTAEPSREFLEKLRQRKYYDHALEYLERLPSNPLATEDAKQTVPLEIALTLKAQSDDLRDPVQREEKLDLAHQQLKAFLAAQPDHALAPSAQAQLADLSLQRAGLLIQRAERAAAQDKDGLLRDARSMLDEAQAVYAASFDEARTQLKAMGDDVAPGDRQGIAHRDRYRRQWVQARMNIADVTYKKSKAAPTGSSDRAQYLSDAAKQYAVLADDFKFKIVGMYARVLAGICYQDLDQPTKALDAYEEILSLPEDNDAEVRGLKIKALRQALECWNQLEKFADSIQRAEPLLSNPRGNEDATPDWVASKYLLAVAMEKHAATLSGDTAQRAKLVVQAKRLAQDVIRAPGEYQSQAAVLMAQLNKAPAASIGADKKLEKASGSFDAANKRAVQSLEEISALQLQIGMSQESNQPGPADELASLKKQLSDRQAEAIELVRQALALQNDVSPIDQVNRLRYTLAYLLFNQADWNGAAVVAEFVARRYPDYELSKACGEIALKAYVRLYQTQGEESDRKFEQAQVAAVADYLMTKWPGEKVANEAVHWLLYVTVGRNDVDAAVALVEKLPADSPQRFDAQVRVGRLLWSEYQKQSRLKDDRRPPQAELDKLLQRAQAMLDQGVQLMLKRGEANAVAVDASLALAQIYLDTSQPDKAIPLLEDATIGPLVLVKADHEATQRERLPFEIYRTALRAYITVQPPRLDDALKVMDRLEEFAGHDAQSGEVLTAVYISMGRDLQRQLEELRGRGDADGIKAVSGAFEEFLKRIAQRNVGKNFSSLNWVADTQFTLGQGIENAGGRSPEAAKEHFRQAVKTYEQILALCEKDANFAPSADSVMGVKIRLAVCRRGLGEPKEMEKAIAAFGEILKDTPSLLAVQIEGARTYQAWGALNPIGYRAAILGGAKQEKTGENVIWGWGKIANVMARELRRGDLSDEQQTGYRSKFHEARFQLAQCRFLHATAQKDAEQKRQLELAKHDIRIVFQLYPDMGGDEWKPQYVNLLKNIQKQLGEPEAGLNEFREAAKPAAAAAKS